MPVVISGAATDTNKAVVVWNNKATALNVTASTAASGYPAVNAVDPATWSSWKPTSVPAWIRSDMVVATNIDAVGIAAHTLATSGATIAIERSSDNVTWTNVYTYSPLTDDDILILFPALSYRYWRVYVTGAVANIGYVSFSSKLAFPQTPIDSYTPLHHARQYTKMFNDSIKGAMLGNRVMAAGAETSVDLGFVDRAFVDSPIRGFESHYNQGGTFFYAGWPAGQPLDLGYCRASGDDDIIQIEYVEAGKLAELSFSVRAYVG